MNNESVAAILVLVVVGFCFYREINKAMDKRRVEELKDQEIDTATKQTVSKK